MIKDKSDRAAPVTDVPELSAEQKLEAEDARTKFETLLTTVTRQEMFDRAVRGLRSQGWVRCVNDNFCAYQNDLGHRCAWGWVDTDLTIQTGDVYGLRRRGIGIAATLNDDDATWAKALQSVHDNTRDAHDMEQAYRKFGEFNDLKWPED